EGRHEGPPPFVDGHRVQADIDMLADLGVMETEDGQGEVPAKRGKADAGRYAIRSDGVEYADAFDARITTAGVLRGHLAEGLHRFLIGRAGGLLALANVRVDAKVIPHGIENGVEVLRIDGGLDAGGADQAGERAGCVSATGKAENVEFVAGCIVL